MDTYRDHPELREYLQRLFVNNGIKDELRHFIELTAEICYKHGYLDGERHVLTTLFRDQIKKLAWIAIFITVGLARVVCDWPYGDPTRLFR